MNDTLRKLYHLFLYRKWKKLKKISTDCTGCLTLEWTFLVVYYRIKEGGRNDLLAKNLIYGHETITLALASNFSSEKIFFKSI